MDLSDIQKARDEFSDHDKRYWQAVDSIGDLRNPANLHAWTTISQALHEEYVDLCNKYFGGIPRSDECYFLPDDLLKRIEFFLRAEP